MKNLSTTTYIKTGVLFLRIEKINTEAAHLYEHLVIRSFHDLLRTEGIPPYLYGWVGGETFTGGLFLEYGFYNEKVEKLFLEFIARNQKINKKFLESELVRIQVEAESILEWCDKQELSIQLDMLDGLKFTNLEKTNMVELLPSDTSPEDTIKLRRSKTAFRNITILVGKPPSSLEEDALYLRLIPIISDAINDKFFEMGLYERAVGWPVRNERHNSLIYFGIYGIKRNTQSNIQIQKAAKEALAAINVRTVKEELLLYSEGFLTTPNWHTFPIDFFRHTRIVASRKFIAAHLTAENIHAVLRTLELSVKPTSDDHWDKVR